MAASAATRLSSLVAAFLVLVLADRSALAEVACAVGADADASLLQHPRVLAVGRHRGAAQEKNATCFVSMCGCPADGAMTVYPNQTADWQCTYERGAIPNAWCNQADGQCGRCNGVWCGSAGAAQDWAARPVSGTALTESADHRTWTHAGGQLRHVGSSLCLSEEDGRPVLSGCYEPGLWPGQRFELWAGGRVERLRHWGDNGRKRWAARCLDSQPVEMEDVVVADCAEDIDDGEVWEPLWEEVPLETRLYWAARAS